MKKTKYAVLVYIAPDRTETDMTDWATVYVGPSAKIAQQVARREERRGRMVKIFESTETSKN